MRWTRATSAAAAALVGARAGIDVYVRGEGEMMIGWDAEPATLAGAQYPQPTPGRWATAVIESQGLGLWRDLDEWRRRGWNVRSS